MALRSRTASEPRERDEGLDEKDRSLTTTLSVVIPCFNEASTLEPCIERVRAISSPDLDLEIVIVDDASTDGSLLQARDLERRYDNIRVLTHDRNRGKGAALRTGFREVTGDYVAVQDADLGYDPGDLVRLLTPPREGRADVVLGSRSLSGGAHRVLYFWHSLMNALLTIMSNAFTDLSLTDMETCYKVFRRDVIQSIEIEENRFGFEPEIVAKLADRRLRIYEMGISYDPRTYEEGKKITIKDGLRALYCIVRYNANSTPAALQFLLYLLIGMTAGLVNVLTFALLDAFGWGLAPAVATAFLVAAAFNYWLCIELLFHAHSRWTPTRERIVYGAVVLAIGLVDYAATRGLIGAGFSAFWAKTVATALLPVINFAARRFVVFGVIERGPRQSGTVEQTRE